MEQIDDDIIYSYGSDQYVRFTVISIPRPANPEPGTTRTVNLVRQPATLDICDSQYDDDINRASVSDEIAFLTNVGDYNEDDTESITDTDFFSLLTSACS